MKRGFTLAETALSMALIGLVLIFVLNLFPSALVAQRTAEEQRQAVSLARTLLEQEMDVPFNRLTVGLVYAFDPVAIEGVEYKPILKVSASPDASTDRLRILNVEVGWTSRGRTHSVRRELWRHRLPHRK